MLTFNPFFLKRIQRGKVLVWQFWRLRSHLHGKQVDTEETRTCLQSPGCVLGPCPAWGSSVSVLFLVILQRLVIMHRLTFRFKTHWQFKYCSACLSVKSQVNKDSSSGKCCLQTLSYWFPTPSPVGFCWAVKAAPLPAIQILLPLFLHLFHVLFAVILSF